MNSAKPEIMLIQDSRENLGYGPLFSFPYEVGTLETGDYSLQGFESLIAIERKTLDDLVGCLTKSRKRFESELKRSRLLHRFWVIVECSPQEILTGNYSSQANPKAIWESIMAFQIRYTNFLFAYNRLMGARMTESLLNKYAREHFKIAERITKGYSRVTRGIADE